MSHLIHLDPMTLLSTVVPILFDVVGLVDTGLILFLEERIGIDRPWIALAMIAAAILLAATTIRLSRWYLVASRDRQTSPLSHALFEESYVPIAVTIVALGVYYALRIIDQVETSQVLIGAILTLLTILWGRALIRLGKKWIEIVNESERSYEFTPIFKNLWTIAIVIIGVLLLLAIWDLEVTPFLASAGILGIILGFAAQDAIANLIGGIALYFDNTYKVGDVIVVDEDKRGTVMDIGIRSTTVRTTDNVLITVPNAVLNSTEVINETAPRRHVRIRIPLSAAYGTDHSDVERLVLEACEDAPLIRESPSPIVLFSGFGDSALLFELRAYISHPLSEKRAVDQINRRVYDAFNEEGITIPFPQRELSFLDPEDATAVGEPLGRSAPMDESGEVPRDDPPTGADRS